MKPHLALLLRHASTLRAPLCGLNHVDLALCSDVLKTSPSSSSSSSSHSKKSGREAVLYAIEHLVLKGNRLLSFVDQPWLLQTLPMSVRSDPRGPWTVFCELLFTRCAQLKTLDLSQCAVNEKQADMLCEGLMSGLRERHRLGMSPLDKVTIQGLKRLSPAASNQLKASLLGDGGECVGAREIDCSGDRASRAV